MKLNVDFGIFCTIVDYDWMIESNIDWSVMYEVIKGWESWIDKNLLMFELLLFEKTCQDEKLKIGYWFEKTC